MMKRFFQSINRFFLALERKIGPFLSALCVGIMALALAALFTSPRWELFYHGKGFSNLSMAPFDFSTDSSLRYRILSPLLGYILFLKGPLFKYLMLAFLLLFHSLVYFFHRRKGFDPAESLGIALLLALSTLSFYQLHFPGYNDPVSYVFILLILFYRERKLILSLCLTLLLFNHDNTVFLFPFLFLFLLGKDYSFKNIRKTIFTFLPAILLYALYRSIVNSISEVGFDTSYYFDKENLRWTWDHVSERLAEGIFQAFRVGWLIPLIALFENVRRREYKENLVMLVGFVFIVSQFFIAYDISRLTGLAFPIIILGAWRIREAYGSAYFTPLIWLLVFINLFIPSLCVGALEPIPYPPFWWPDLKEYLGIF